MSSLLTNSSAMTALQTLSLTNKNLATTQNRIATGQKVSTASDNAAYWSIATGMRAQNGVNQAVKDSLGFGSAVVDVAYTGLEAAIKLGESIVAKLASNEQGGIDTDATNKEITALTDQIAQIAKSADFEGQNLLATSGADLTVLAGYVKDSGTPDLITVTAFDLEAADFSDLSTAEATLKTMREAAADFGAAKIRIDSQLDFTSKLMDAVDRGVGALVDADMNAESARLSALQVQQQLGIQALSIANSSSQSILSLFR
ncbi:flagellin [Mesorhizobium sp. DCY119]|uniref:flagellin N-terminal helical domain-containing protein n=1 Tax=Mesorhizobium sp. DCY119 TaxID=2108445 RepID=UPI000E6D0726|nr:flagellin [Mesorhizobium sp. DCY119]RJG44089.1 flagellin [Mesorhizobium sp. DCY119]